MADIQLQPYQEDAVFQPGTGGVFHADPGTEPPSLKDLRTWVLGDRTQPIGNFEPLGYTSVEDLPGLGTETEGGEKKGVWENPDFRITPVTTTETIKVQPVQWSPVPISHRFGKGARLDGDKGLVAVPNVYEPVERSLMVVILDGSRPLVLHYYRVASAPDGDLELDRDNFATLPVMYTVLSQPGKANKMNILGYHLQTADTDSDGTPDILDTDTAPGTRPGPSPRPGETS